MLALHASPCITSLFPVAFGGQLVSAHALQGEEEAEKHRGLVQGFDHKAELEGTSSEFYIFSFCSQGDIFPSVGRRSKAQVSELEPGEAGLHLPAH